MFIRHFTSVNFGRICKKTNESKNNSLSLHVEENKGNHLVSSARFQSSAVSTLKKRVMEREHQRTQHLDSLLMESKRQRGISSAIEV